MQSALDDALQTWQGVATSLDFGPVVERHRAVQAAAGRLRHDPPSFDATDVDELLSYLSSARRMRRQIMEANEPELLIMTLRAFLFNEEPLAARFATYPSLIRYAGLPILGELYGWVHADHAPIYSRRALATLRALGWQIPARNYPAFAAAYASLRTSYELFPPVAPTLPRLLEIDRFLEWLADQPPVRAPAPPPRAEAPPPSEPAVPPLPRPTALRAAPLRAIREFGAGYGAVPPERTWADSPLAMPSPPQMARAEAAIRQQLALPTGVVQRAVAHLLAGRHLVLTGAPGTGKSHLAHLLTTTVFGYSPMLVTATAEWSAFDVIGGLVPVAEEDGALRYTIRPGHVYAALAANWVLAPDGRPASDAEGMPLRRPPEADATTQGLWLIIDELNRADMDKAFGELFSALETGQLRVPRAGPEGSMLLPIPRDFRIIATLNTRDRHFLFTLSDALKRRFAFVELLPPNNPATERETLLRRAAAALQAQGLPVPEGALAIALDALLPFALVARALSPATPLGSAPLLAALRYLGAVAALGGQNAATDPAHIEEAVLAEVAPQLEGLRELPLTVLALLARGQAERVVPRLERAIAGAGLLDPATAQALSGVAQALQRLAAWRNEPLAADLSALQTLDAGPSLEGERSLHSTLVALREPGAQLLPRLAWPRVAELLEGWLAERVL